VYLPAGYGWYDFWTDQRIAGGQAVLADAALDVMPLYVRAGSIVPMGQPMQYADESPDMPLELHIYPGRDGSFLLYEDEGDSYNYEQGAFSTIPIHWQDTARRLLLDARTGCYPGMQERRAFQVVLHGEGQPEHRQLVYGGEPIMLGF
jgi:alpha-D-xyloside xylohydrolase